MKSTTRNRGVSVLVRILLLLNLIPLLVHGQEFDKAFEQTAQLVVMLDVDYAGTPEFGAGIIFGRDQNRLLIATAYHVLHRGASQPGRISARLRNMPDAPLEATLLRHASDGELDLAVLSVEASTARGIDVCAVPFARLGNAAGLKRHDSVSLVGNPNGMPWEMQARPDEVSEIAGNEIKFQSAFISSGHSGGGLLDGGGNLIGMTIADQPPFGRAINIDAVLLLLKQWGYPVRLHPVLEKGLTPLHVAAGKGDALTVKTLLAECGGANVVDDHNATPLHYAASSGSVDTMSFLLKAGADIQARDEDGDAPLEWAGEKGQSEGVKFLLGAGAKIDATDKRMRTALHFASDVKYRQLEIVKLLALAGADINATDAARERPLDLLAEVYFGREKLDYQGRLDTMRFLVGAGAKIDTKSLRRFAENAPSAEDLEMLEVLLPAVTDIDVRVDSVNGVGGVNSLIHLAVGRKHLAIVKLLTNAGANVNAVDGVNYGRTPLFIAIESDQQDIADFLLAHGAAVRAQETSVQDPGISEERYEALLWHCVEKQSLAAVRVLIAAGINPNIPNLLHYRALSLNLLQLAQKLGDPEIVKALAEAGAK